jgi:hypothetical protein
MEDARLEILKKAKVFLDAKGMDDISILDFINGLKNDNIL